MKAVFADTFYYLALLSQDDEAHDQAVAFSRNLPAPIVASAWVLTEVADALASPETRGIFREFLERLRSDPTVTVLPATQDLFDHGLNLYFRRPDKEGSLTDCISFVVMDERDLSDALTADHHFEQAGFKALLKKNVGPEFPEERARGEIDDPGKGG